MLAYASRKGGGQSLDYVDPSAYEPSAPAGRDLLKPDGLILRPKIGGFYPSIMKGVVNSGAYAAPLVAYTAKKMFNGSTRKTKKGGASRANQEKAKAELMEYGKPSAVNYGKYAKLKAENPEKAAEFLEDYIVRKQKTAKKRGSSPAGLAFVNATAGPFVRAASPGKKISFKNLLSQAFNDLRSQGYKPNAATARSYAARTRNGKNVSNLMRTLQTRRNAATARGNKNIRNRTVKAAAATASLRRPVSPLELGPVPAFVKPKNKTNWYQSRAKTYLSKYGPPSAINTRVFAKKLKDGENAGSWLEEYRTRKTQTMLKSKAPAATTRRGRSETPKKTAVPFTMGLRSRSAAAAAIAAPVPADSVEKAMKELRNIGTPKRYHGIALAALRKRGENTSEFLKNFKNSKYGKSS
jgi:hypothetical protein